MIRTGFNPHPNTRRKQIRTQMLTVRRFQYKYAFYLTYFSVIMSLIIGGITLYLLNHNYHLLVRAELVAAPHGWARPADSRSDLALTTGLTGDCRARQ